MKTWDRFKPSFATNVLNRVRTLLASPQQITHLQSEFSTVVDRVDSLSDLVDKMNRVERLLELALSEQAKQMVPTPPEKRRGAITPLTSCLCTQKHFQTDAFAHWCERWGAVPALHRKQWEFYFVCQALHERGCLQPGKRGLGFAVGQEPLPSLFAGAGCEIVATDQEYEQALATGWRKRNQHAGGLDELNKRGLCTSEQFSKLACFRAVDMNDIPPDLGGFDFAWSCCALEHLGSIEHGARFVLESMKCLKPGGVAVHTTEYNVSSNDATVSTGRTVIFRKRDIESMVSALTAAGHTVEPLNLDSGNDLADQLVDAPPFKQPHLKLRLANFVATSIGLIVTKGRDARTCDASERADSQCQSG